MIDETKVVDFVAFSDKSRQLIMAITDYLPWDKDEFEHLHLLQGKLNYYLGVLESGEFYEQFPKSGAYKIIIEVNGLYPLSKNAHEFYEKAKTSIEGFGFELKFRLASTGQ